MERSTGPDDASQSPGRPMSLLEHLQELRLRLRNSMLVLASAALASSFFANDFFRLLARPVQLALKALGQPATIVKQTPGEGFWFTSSCLSFWAWPWHCR
jgi:Sec-independent protein secretion pathway component TatC